MGNRVIIILLVLVAAYLVFRHVRSLVKGEGGCGCGCKGCNMPCDSKDDAQAAQQPGDDSPQ